MKKINMGFLKRKPFLLVLISGLAIASLITSFAFSPLPGGSQIGVETLVALPTSAATFAIPVTGPTAPALPNSSVPSGSPAYCYFSTTLNVVNRFGRDTAIQSNTILYRVAGDTLNLSLAGGSQNSGAKYSLFMFTPDMRSILGPVSQFDASGNLSVIANTGVYAIAVPLSQDQFNNCGGSSSFLKSITSQGNIYGVGYIFNMVLLQPTANPMPTLAPATVSTP